MQEQMEDKSSNSLSFRYALLWTNSSFSTTILRLGAIQEPSVDPVNHFSRTASRVGFRFVQYEVPSHLLMTPTEPQTLTETNRPWPITAWPFPPFSMPSLRAPCSNLEPDGRASHSRGPRLSHDQPCPEGYPQVHEGPENEVCLGSACHFIHSGASTSPDLSRSSEIGAIPASVFQISPFR